MSELLTAIRHADLAVARRLLIAQSSTANSAPLVQAVKATGHPAMEALFVRYANWQDAYSTTELQTMLVDFMAWLSEDCYAAGWLKDLEVELWEVLHNPAAQAYAIWAKRSSLESLDDLRYLAELTQSWAVWDEDAGKPVPVSLAQWRNKYEHSLGNDGNF